MKLRLPGLKDKWDGYIDNSESGARCKSDWRCRFDLAAQALRGRMKMCKAPATQQRLNEGQVIANLVCPRRWASAMGAKMTKTQSGAPKSQICEQVVSIQL